MMPREFSSIFPAEVVSVQGKPYVFSDIRIDRASVPDGLYAYDVRDDCDGEFWQIQPSVMVNYWGTIIGLEPIDLDEHSQYWCPPEPENEDLSSEGFFIDYVQSMDEFRSEYKEIKDKAKA